MTHVPGTETLRTPAASGWMSGRDSGIAFLHGVSGDAENSRRRFHRVEPLVFIDGADNPPSASVHLELCPTLNWPRAVVDRQVDAAVRILQRDLDLHTGATWFASSDVDPPDKPLVLLRKVQPTLVPRVLYSGPQRHFEDLR